MKKSKLTKVIAIVLALTMLSASFGAVTVGASSAYPILSSDNPIGMIFADIIDTFLRIVTDFLASLFGDGPGFVPADSPDAEALAAANFYEGTGSDFQDAAQPDAQWHLGYANASLIPEDYDNGTYYIGGYIAIENGFTNVVEGIAEIPGIGKDDMKVRCMSLSDGTDNGTVLFAVIDSIGVTNADIKDIRAILADYAKDNNIVAINVSSTHTHSCIDTEGLWTRNIAKLVSNGVISGTQAEGELQQGTNPAYMSWMKEKVASALIEAHQDMKPGKLTYTTKDIGQEYFQNKNRPSSGQVIGYDGEGNLITNSYETGFKSKIAMTNIERFIFTPDDEACKPTMILNVAAHPDVAGLPTSSNSGREISGDYLFYCGYYLEKAGYNFIFFQGAIAGIYMSRSVTGDNIETQQRVEESQRYGYELARMALNLTNTEEEVSAEAWKETSDIYAELEANTTLIDAFDENGNPIEQIMNGRCYTLIIDAQGKTVNVDDSAKTVKIYDGEELIYDLAYASNAEITFEAAASTYAVTVDGSLAALIVTGENKRVICPSRNTVALYDAENTLIAQLSLGDNKAISSEQALTVAGEDGVIMADALNPSNNYFLAIDAQGMNVAADNSAHTITVTNAADDSIEYVLNLGATDYVQYDPTSSTYVIVDTTTMSFIGAVANGENQKIDYSEAGKVILRDAENNILGEIAIGDREIITPETTFYVPSVEGAATQCQINPLYSVWFEDWNKDAAGNDVIPEEVEVEPFLNLYITQVDVPVTNTLITTMGKLNMANYVVKSHDDGTYSTVTEIGYMELGNQFKAVFLPGEICQDLVAPNGASLYAENAITGSAFSKHVKHGATSASAIFGDDVRCFGLMNDAIGYVVPDNDYTMGDPANHYHELISLGQYVGSSLIDGLYELAEEIH